MALRAPTQSKLALSRVWMCDEGEAAAEEPAAEEKEGSIFDTISALPAELIEKIKGLMSILRRLLTSRIKRIARIEFDIIHQHIQNAALGK